MLDEAIQSSNPASGSGSFSDETLLDAYSRAVTVLRRGHRLALEIRPEEIR